MATQKERYEATRAALLSAFRSAFLTRGVEATTTQAVLDEVGLSKGAMYHHFRSKADIVEAIFAEDSRKAIERAGRRAEEVVSPVGRLKAACLAWMEEVSEPDVSNVIFKIGPTVLGTDRAKDIENEVSLRQMRHLVERAIEAGELAPHDADITAVFINALVAEAAVYKLRAGKDTAADLERAIDAILASRRA